MISKRQEVGIRVPDNGICRSLLKEFGSPILNASVDDGNGALINDPEKLHERYRNKVDLMLEAGNSKLGLSTVLDLTGEKALVVREGVGDISQLMLV
jgi:tRNA A37 threonylcarbamoyladenosine synthetase subunit TsaC/SUA5/YrdC